MKKLFSSCLFILSASILMAQPAELQQKVLFTVEDDTVTAGEYMAVYNKNRNLGEDIDPKTPREYLDLYVNFKLKVHEAKEMGMDTVPTFVREYSGYRDQLAKPYLNDKDVTTELVKEAYNRMKTDVRASHIMIMADEAASPEDTLKAYKDIMGIKKQLDRGAEFSSLAEEYSADKYSAQQGGDLGYFTAFDMVYAFESATYKADLGEVVGPIRTRFGYHMIRLTDQREARGSVQVAHILILDNDKVQNRDPEKAEKKINEIYQQLEGGEDFATLAKQHSEDPTSAQKGGVLYPFGINKMYPEFEDAAFGLENIGDYTRPVRTPIGWHILKLVGKSGLGTYEEEEAAIREKLDRDERSRQSQITVMKRLKKEYGYREYPKVMKLAFDQVDESLLQRSWEANKVKGASKVLVEFGSQKFTVQDFLNFVQTNQRGVRGDNLYVVLNGMYKSFTEAELLNYEKSRLEMKYPEFRLLSREYFEGILLFDLTERKVWKKSVGDSVGLQAYYNDNVSNYMWKERYQAYVIDAADKKTAKKAAKMINKGQMVSDVSSSLNEESELQVKIDSNLYESGTLELLNDLPKEVGTTGIFEKDGRFFVVIFKEIMAPTNKSFEEARGLVISDYQNYLEQEWLKDLKSRYEVKMNDDILKKVVTKLESES